MPDDIVNSYNIPKVIPFLNDFKSHIYKKRTIVLQADERQDDVFFIKDGYMKAYRISEKGEELTIAILKPNDFFPMACGLQTVPNDYYLEAITTLELVRVPQIKLENFMKNNPEIFYYMSKQIVSRIGSLLTKMEYLVLSDAYTKIAIMVLMCAKKFGEPLGDNVLVKIPLTQKDIGTLAGVTRETTCVEMKKMEKKGLIYYQGRALIVKDIKALEDESSLLISPEDNLMFNSL